MSNSNETKLIYSIEMFVGAIGGSFLLTLAGIFPLFIYSTDDQQKTNRSQIETSFAFFIFYFQFQIDFRWKTFVQFYSKFICRKSIRRNLSSFISSMLFTLESFNKSNLFGNSHWIYLLLFHWILIHQFFIDNKGKFVQISTSRRENLFFDFLSNAKWCLRFLNLDPSLFEFIGQFPR